MCLDSVIVMPRLSSLCLIVIVHDTLRPLGPTSESEGQGGARRILGTCFAGFFLPDMQ